MLNSYRRFIEFFNRSSAIDALYNYLLNVIKIQPIELEDLLRGQIVNSVSALDRLIHDLVRDGMLEIFMGLRQETFGFSNFQLSIQQHSELHSPATISKEFTFDQYVTKAISHLSYQDADKIKEGLNFIWNEQYKWQRIAYLMGLNERDIKIQLKNIVIRRNQIVHEMDMTLVTGDLQPIDYKNTIDSVEFIKTLGTAIYNSVK